MLAVFTGFFQRNIMILAVAAAAVVGVVAVLAGARRAGRNAERVDQLKRQLHKVEKANAIRREISDSYTRDGGPPDRLRKFYID